MTQPIMTGRTEGWRVVVYENPNGFTAERYDEQTLPRFPGINAYGTMMAEDITAHYGSDKWDLRDVARYAVLVMFPGLDPRPVVTWTDNEGNAL